jgi:hypothetical protein
MTILLFFTVGIAYASLFEWILHRFVMHRPVGRFRYAYEAHAQTHHNRFRADGSYHLGDHPHDLATIPMAWWNGPVLIAVSSAPFWAAGWLLGLWSLPASVTAAIACYYVTYEYIHWCMHKPAGRWFERTRLFQFLNGHHLLHHAWQGKNYNVVLPLWDWILGTLIRRAPKAFPQPGPPTPDVQP